MSQVTLSIGGRRYTVSCAAGEESHVASLGAEIDSKITGLGANRSPQETQNLLFAALFLAEDLHQARAASPSSSSAEGQGEKLLAANDALKDEIAELRTTEEALRREIQAVTDECEELRRVAAENAGALAMAPDPGPDVAPSLERFADLLENCAAKLEAKASSA